MALVQCSFFSESLGLSSSMTVIIPQAPKSHAGINGGRKGARKYPVLYLLHGMSDDHTSWSRQTFIERYVSGMGLVVVMPAVNRSYYTTFSM